LFLAEEDKQLRKAGFQAKLREELQPGEKILFNGAYIQMEGKGAHRMLKLTPGRQMDKINTIRIQKDTNEAKADYITQRARGAYIATICQPEVAFKFAHAAQFQDPPLKQFKLLNQGLEWQRANKDRGLKYVPLDLTTLKIVTFMDASFANNADMSSQIGFAVVLTDASGAANLVHWSSVKARRVTRSVLAAELFAMALGFDAAASIKTTLDQFLGTHRQHQVVPLLAITDSRSLYDCLAKLGTTTEKRLMIDIMCLRQSYERREIAELACVESQDNIADAMTKERAGTALTRLIDTNRLDIPLMRWVERPNTA
jgi:hypothetical protein